MLVGAWPRRWDPTATRLAMASQPWRGQLGHLHLPTSIFSNHHNFFKKIKLNLRTRVLKIIHNIFSYFLITILNSLLFGNIKKKKMVKGSKYIIEINFIKNRNEKKILYGQEND